MTADTAAPKRSYGCANGDGNPFDVVLLWVEDSQALFLCLPCLIRTAFDAARAINGDLTPEEAAAIEAMPPVDQVPYNNGRQTRRGHEAPAHLTDSDLVDAYDSLVLDDDPTDAAP